MSFIKCRELFEKPVAKALADLATPVTLYYDNQLFTDDDAGSEYATISINWGPVTEDALNSVYEHLRGTIVVRAFCPKGRGPARCEEVMMAMVKALNEISLCTLPNDGVAFGRTRNMNGPSFSALDEDPYFGGQADCAFVAKV